MNFLGLVIGTGVMWGLTYLVALPLARLLGGSDTNSGAIVPNAGAAGALAAEQPTQVDAVDTVSGEVFVLVHVLVLGAAGFLLGATMGYYFIGFGWKAKLWPGIIALIVGSLLGAIRFYRP